MGKLSRTLSKLKEKKKESDKDKYKISEDSAMDQIVDILDYYDIPIERFEEIEKTESAGENILDSLIGYFRTGQLQKECNEKNELIIIQTTQGGSKLNYQEIRAKHKKVMDKFDPAKENYKRMYAFLGALCGMGSDAIEQLKTGGKQNDLACAEILGTLFLAV